MILTEDYCSSEIVKLLKEKGFKCGATYSKGFVKDRDGFVGGLVRHEDKITHQLAMKWLRKKHNIDIEIDADVGMLGIKVYTPFISTYKSVTDNTNKLRQYKRGLHYKDDKGVVPALQHFPKHEEAVESALKFCLTKLI